MNNKKVLIAAVLAFALLLAGASVLYSRLGAQLAPDQLAVQQTLPPSLEETLPTEAMEPTAPEQSQAETFPAPDFTVYDLAGNPVRLSDGFGKPLVLNFWASWCGPCQMEMPDFQEKYLELGDEVTFMIVNMTDGSRETVEIASAFIRDMGYTFPVYYDTDMDAAITYSVYSLPTTYFVDAQGNLVAQATGAIDAQTLQRGIDLITQ